MAGNVNYAASEKFRAEVHKHVGYLLCTPLAWSIFQYLTDNRILNKLTMLIELVLFSIGYLFVNNSCGIMKSRDVKYVKRIPYD